jgi:glutathione peroxidase
MKQFFSFIVLCLSAFFASAQSTLTFHDYSEKTILGDTISLSQFYGKKVMVVNTASECVYTPQYEDLEALYQQYKQYNFEIIGFPCNDFGGQEPHDDSAIIDFCEGYDVTFQMMSKVEAITGDTAGVYKWLQRADLNGVSNAHVAWNFHKFLIDEAGHWVRSVPSATSPLATSITSWIMTPSVISGINNPQDLNELVKLTSSNPISSSLDLIINNTGGQTLNVRLFSETGQLIGTVFLGNTSGSQTISYPVTSLQSGIYFLETTNSTGRNMMRVAVVR